MNTMRLAVLKEWVARLRQAAKQNPEAALRAEANRLAQAPKEAEALLAALSALVQTPRQSALFARTGVRSALGLGREVLRRIGHRLLPDPQDAGRLDAALHTVFHAPGDAQWVAAVSTETWRALAQALRWQSNTPAAQALHQALHARLAESILTLSHQAAGGSLDRELLQLMPELESADSPFLAQSQLLSSLRAQPMPEPSALAALPALLDGCQAALNEARRRAPERGITIRVSYLLTRLEQQIQRLRLLTRSLAAPSEQRATAWVGLFKALVAAANAERRVFGFVANDLRLLARNMTDHASRRGEHYIATDRAQRWHMATAAAGGGVLIALLALIKLRIALMHLPPLTEGLLYSLNYGLGFVLIHLLGMTVATKQPAMTAATLAQRLKPADHESPDPNHRRLLMDVLRSQSIAVAGNVLLALPIGCLLALGWSWYQGVPIAPLAKAESLLRQTSPLHANVLGFAAVAGVGLFLSGLVAGFFDNQCRTSRFRERLAAAPWLRGLAPGRAQRMADFVDAHYGAILGNLFFGFYLGLVGQTAVLTGLPIDIRHIAFSSANAGIAAMLVDRATVQALGLEVLVGIVAIGALNLIVSFSLAWSVALLSRGPRAQAL